MPAGVVRATLQTAGLVLAGAGLCRGTSAENTFRVTSKWYRESRITC